MELRVGNKYRLGRKIGSGSFGDIYLGKYFLSQSCNRFFWVFSSTLGALCVKFHVYWLTILA